VVAEQRDVSVACKLFRERYLLIRLAEDAKHANANEILSETSLEMVASCKVSEFKYKIELHQKIMHNCIHK
jgi:hypothetical protein